MELQPLDTNAVATSPSKLKDSLTNDAASMNSTATELSENVTQQSSPVAALKSGAYDLSKMDMSEAEAPKEQDLSTIALSERLSSKQWKHRVSGYEELLQMFKKAGTATTPFVEHVSTVVTAITIEKTTKTICAAVDLVKAYIEFAPAPSCLEQLGTTESLVHHIVKLTFAQNKSCLNRAYETIFTMIEKIEDGGTIVTETLCTYFSKSQKLKVAVAAAACLRESIAAFGCNAGAMPFGPIVKHVNALFEHTSKNVRSAAEKLVVEISAWTKTCDIFSFTSLKDIQQRDLRTACDKVIGRGELRTPTRWTPKTIVNRNLLPPLPPPRHPPSVPPCHPSPLPLSLQPPQQDRLLHPQQNRWCWTPTMNCGHKFLPRHSMVPCRKQISTNQSRSQNGTTGMQRGRMRVDFADGRTHLNCFVSKLKILVTSFVPLKLH